MYTSDSLNAQCQLMATLSPLVREKLDSEQWRANFEDSSICSDADVTNALFDILTADLSTYGLRLTGAHDDYTGNEADLDMFLDLLTWLLPNTLYPKLRSDPGLRAGLSRIVMGGVSDDDTVIDYMDFLGGDGAYKPQLDSVYKHFFLKIRSNAIYTTMIKNMLIHADEDISTDTYLINDIHGYHVATAACADRLTAAARILAPYLTDDAERTAFEKRIYFATRSVLSPDLLNSLGWLLTVDTQTLSDDAKAIYDKKKKVITAGLKIAPIYYQSRHMTPERVDVMGIVCHIAAFEEVPLKEAYEKADALYKDLLPKIKFTEN